MKVKNSEHLEKLIKEGCSFMYATSCVMESDGNGGCYESSSYRFLHYVPKGYKGIKVPTSKTLKDFRKFMKEKL